MKGKQSLALILFVLLALQLKTFAQEQNLEIVFQGNKMFSSEVLLAELEKCPSDFRKVKEDEFLKSSLSVCLRGTVYDYYGSRGVFNNKLQTDISIENQNGKKTAVVKIEESEPVILGKVEIENDSLELLSKKKLLEMFPVKSGELMNYVALREFSQKLRDIYFEAGYLGFDTDGETDVYVDPGTGRKTVDFRARLIEGKPFTIKAIRFVRGEYPGILKNADLTDDLLQKTFGLKEGEVYRESKLQEGLKQLNSLGGFAEVSNSRKFDKFGLGSGHSTNLDFRENYDENTVEIVININEPFIK